jgi:hypothetical protein
VSDTNEPIYRKLQEQANRIDDLEAKLLALRLLVLEFEAQPGMTPQGRFEAIRNYAVQYSEGL